MKIIFDDKQEMYNVVVEVSEMSTWINTTDLFEAREEFVRRMKWMFDNEVCKKNESGMLRGTQMFENIRKVLDEFENTHGRVMQDVFNVSKEDEDIIVYFNVNLAKALMQDEYTRAESVAKIILAAKELSNEITVKVQ